MQLTTRVFSISMGLIIVFLVSLLGCNTQKKATTMTPEQLKVRGAYLTVTMGCHDCHSPKIFTAIGPVPDTTRALSGYPANDVLPKIDPNVIGPDKWVLMNAQTTAFVGPWGVSFAANLTPDEQTGTGLWTDEIFMTAIRTGKHMGEGRAILPPMPWMNIRKATDEDLQSIFAYLKSIKPINNRVPAPIPPTEMGAY